MAGELRHRGPDGVGLYLDGPFGMVATRLAIIDLMGGNPPVANEDGSFWTIQNGEIYDFPERRQELEALGHRFSTESDTEVIVHAYEQWGVDCPAHLNGEFAFAVWDRAARETFLARDRFGVRPLFVIEADGDVAFASEIPALLRHPGVERRLDPTALVEAFTLWSVQGERSAFAGVRELPPGSWMRIGRQGAERPTRWWSLSFAPREGRRRERPELLAEELRALLDEATRIRLRADVPVGVYLSGGLDSSATAALARRHVRHPLQAFGLGFDDDRFDETSHQRQMAEAIDVDLHRVSIRDRDVADAFPDVVARAATPMLRTAPAPLWRLSKLVRDHDHKVVLTGEGADELFGGYGIFQETMVRRFWARQPDSRTRPALLTRIYPYLSRDLGRSGGFLDAFFREGLEQVDDPLYGHRPRFATSARNVRFLSADARAAAATEGSPEERLIDGLPSDFGGFGPLGQAQWLEIETFLTGYLLHAQGDRMLMAHGVEGRFPFLDVHVAAFAADLPERARLADLHEKPLLRRAMAPLLPPQIARRPKRPYRAPILRPFFGPEAPEWVADLLTPGRVEASGLFDAAAVTKLAAKCRRRAMSGMSESDEMGLVGVLSTMLLIDRLVEAPDLARAAEPTKEAMGDRVVRSIPTNGHRDPVGRGMR